MSLGPSTSSQSLKVFERICQELLTRLETDRSEAGRAFVAQAQDLARTLARWPTEPPSPEVRAAVISRVLDLHRTVMDHSTGGPSHPPST
jgi:hypothetical protein